MPKFRKKPVVIDAMRYTGYNALDVLAFTGRDPRFNDWFKNDEVYLDRVRKDGGLVKIFTLEGPMLAIPGDWIIRGVNGEHYPCKPDIFEKTYEAVDEP